ncbi:hypothetical protein [Epibacterium ulvae]|uniref:hypothetical protein n=1 Tax=Epibacterium ulvae TaxID=1156985 RepID=UPI002490B64C|nr:hypothetical protein [Epibacterium ulvae]
MWHSLRLLSSLGLILPLIAGIGQAGAWLEPVGQGFSATTATVRQGGRTELSYYAAYGLRPRLNLGVDLNRSQDYAHAFVFLRQPLGDQTLASKWAVELGAGGLKVDGIWMPALRGSLSFGRGLTGSVSGWIAADFTFETNQITQQRTYKLDATLGIRPNTGPAHLLQFESNRTGSHATSYSLTPALLFPLPYAQSEGLLGLSFSPGRKDQLGLKLGLWHRF